MNIDHIMEPVYKYYMHGIATVLWFVLGGFVALIVQGKLSTNKHLDKYCYVCAVCVVMAFGCYAGSTYGDPYCDEDHNCDDGFQATNQRKREHGASVFLIGLAPALVGARFALAHAEDQKLRDEQIRKQYS